jgi:hypothetical protein
VQEATALFGATHYSEYHFLWTLSDQIGFEGIEHHQSSDNRSSERSLIDDDLRHSHNIYELLPHEYVHSWNSKYRRPSFSPPAPTPVRRLLWVYGSHGILGMVLSAQRPSVARGCAPFLGEAQPAADRCRARLASAPDTTIAAQRPHPSAGWRPNRATNFYVDRRCFG